MPRQREFETTVRNGFPVLVRYEIEPMDQSVGIMSDYPIEVEVLTLAGKPADFLKLDQAELEALIDRLPCEPEEFYDFD